MVVFGLVNEGWGPTIAHPLIHKCNSITQGTARPLQCVAITVTAEGKEVQTTIAASVFLYAIFVGLCSQLAWAIKPAGSERALRGGTPIPIDNAGFEANFAPPGCFAIFTPTNWTLHDPNGVIGGNSAVGVIDPTGTTNFPAGAPEGLNVALIFLGEDMGQGPVGLTQVLSATLQPSTTYTLTVEVGNIASGMGPPPCDAAGFFDLDGFPGYQVQLLAGGVVVAQDNDSLHGLVPEGEFRLSTLTLTTGDTHAQMGQPLEVRLINLNVIETPADPGIEVDFDDVQLTAAPAASVPAASQWGLLMMSLLVCIAATIVMHSQPGYATRFKANFRCERSSTYPESRTR